MTRSIAAAILATSAICAPTPANAWGQNGHRIVGELAEARVGGRAKAEIALILGTENLAEASTWADEQRANPEAFWQNEAGPLHYVTIPEGQKYSEIGAPPEGDAITALERFSAIVRDRNASQADRALALRFITHIVGDLHQPLHAGNGTDRGGNDVKLLWFGEPTNLHSVWDTKMIEGQNLSYSEYADRLDRRISPEEIIDWWEPNPLVWIGESAAIRDDIYPEQHNEVSTLSWSYQYQHLPTVERRLQQGGIRLAAYLDDLFAT